MMSKSDLLRIFLFTSAVVNCGCAYGVLKEPPNSAAALSEIRPTVENHPSSDNKYINQNGWEIPDVGTWPQTDTFFRNISHDKGSITIQVTEYAPPTEVITDKPFSSIGSAIGLIRLRLVRAYGFSGRIFCYRIQANEIDRSSNTHASTSGTVFFFSYYDYDGDGRFETLLLGGTDDLTNASFYSLPHVPEWQSAIKTNSHSRHIN